MPIWILQHVQFDNKPFNTEDVRAWYSMFNLDKEVENKCVEWNLRFEDGKLQITADPSMASVGDVASVILYILSRTVVIFI